jgi:dienelactone hydrolase
MTALSAIAEQRKAGPIGTPEGRDRMQLHWVPILVSGEPTPDLIQMRICRPQNDEPVGIAIVNHGSPDKASARPAMKPIKCNSGVARYFLKKQLVVAFPLRRGYGESGGSWAENYESCNRPNFVTAGLATAVDIASVVSYLHTLPYVRSDRIIVFGQSAGGWGTVAYASTNPANILGFINFSGGRGANCRSEKLIEAAGVYGTTAHQPVLWLYTENDALFNPSLSGSMYEAFIKAGGQATYRLLPAWGKNGHALFFGNNGSRVWGPIFDDYLKSIIPP